MQSAAEAEGGRRRIPQLAPDWNSSQVSLSPAEGFLLSRIDGVTPWDVLVHIGGLSPDEIDDRLKRWLEEGVLVVTETELASPQKASQSDPKPPPKGPEDDLLDEGLDISVDLQRRILAYEKRLGRSYHELLDLEFSADAKDIKRAYFQLSREFHPDRYYRRELGEFKPRLEKIFRKLVEAYELLSDPATRAEIERSMPPLPRVSADEAPGEDAQAAGAGNDAGAEPLRPPKRHDKWSRLARLRKQFRIPEEVLAERRFKASQFFDAAMVSAKRERWAEAAASVRLAIAFDPFDDRFKAEFANVQAHVHQMRADELLAQANASWDDSSRQDALKLYEEALHYRPSDAEMNDRAATLCLELREFDKAREYAETACDVNPDAGNYRTTLGTVYRAQGIREKAEAAFKEALRLGDPKAEQQLASLRNRRGKRGGNR